MNDLINLIKIFVGVLFLFFIDGFFSCVCDRLFIGIFNCFVYVICGS